MARPKKQFSDKQVKQIKDLAFKGCQTRTISTITGIPQDTLKRHFASVLELHRAKRKASLRASQTRLARSNAKMAIFLGKNELEQTDSKDINLGGSVKLILEDE